MGYANNGTGVSLILLVKDISTPKEIVKSLYHDWQFPPERLISFTDTDKMYKCLMTNKIVCLNWWLKVKVNFYKHTV